MEFELVIRGGTVASVSGADRADIGISDGRIEAIGNGLPVAPQEIDASGMVVAPGGIDVHTHFDMYIEYLESTNADDYESGTRAAAVGGITTIINFATQERGKTLREAVERETGCARGKAHIDDGFHVGVSDLKVPGTLDELVPLADEGLASVKIFTTLPNMLDGAGILRILELTSRNGILVNVHAEDDPLCKHLTRNFMSEGKTGVEYYPLARPPVSEAIATARVAAYARTIGAPVYFVHLSSKDALDEVRASRNKGGEVYVETRPAYLYLDETKYSLPDREGHKFTCLPPLRHIDNQQALWEGLRNGEIQTYATDHAPWQLKQKLDPSRPFPWIPAGLPSVQTSIGMLYAEGVKKGRISLGQFVAVTATNPAKLFGMWPQKGSLLPGADADLVIIDPERRVRITAENIQSNTDYDPFEGYEGVGWPVMTLSRGDLIARDGEVLSTPGRGRFLKRDRYQLI